MATWDQSYPGQGGPPPPGFQYPGQNYGQGQGGYPGGQGGYPGVYPQPGFQVPPQGFAGPPGYGQPPFVSPPSAGMYGGAEAGYANVEGLNTFDDKNVRRGFIRKVYSLLMVQLLVTLGIMSVFVFHEPTKLYVRQNPWLNIVMMIALFAVMIPLACCGDVRRRSPLNMILLGTFTVIEGISLGIVSAFYKADEVMLAVGVTAAVCLALTLFAFQTKIDFTLMGGALFVAVIVLLLFGLLAMVLRMPILNLVYACVGALIFSLYLIYDTQMMMGGKKYSISPEEYIFATLNLYLDIINLFMMILSIIGYSRD